MKNLLYILALSVSLSSCGGGGDNPTPLVVNTAPTVPTLASPVNNSLCIDNVVNFQWNASTDAEGGVITYQIEVSKNTQFSSPLAHNVTSTTASKSITLEKGIAYYWRVKATDSKSAASNYSATFNLYTEGVGITNHLPFSPVLVSPALNSVQSAATVNLQWIASDVDAGDNLTYDVYFGTASTPTAIVSANQSANSLSRTVATSTKYYWKVIVKDNKGGQTVGQIWSFTTD